MLPAGLGFNAVSPKALAAAEQARLPRSYWDWRPIVEANETGFWPYTSATNLLYGLREALAMLREEGLDAVFARHARHAAATRAAVEAWGLEVLALDPREQSPVLTGVVVPEEIDADEVRRVILERFDMSLGAGLGKLKGRIFRIGHLGDFNDLMLAGTLCGVEMGLRLAGVPIEPGVPAALERLEREPVARVTALEDVRVLELTQVMAGPFCGQVLADMGADVVKVEPPGGDSTRRSLGFRMGGDDTAAFLAVNRNKRSLDARPQGRRAPRGVPPPGARRRRRAREQPPRRRGAARRRLRDAARAQPAARLRVDLGLRPDGPLRAAAGLRPDRAGAGRRDERHRRARRRPGQVRDPDRRPLRRAVLRRRDPVGAARARAHGPRPVRRHLAVRGRAGALDLGDGGAVGDRPRAGQARLGAPADRALPGAAHGRRLHHGRRQHAESVRAAVRGAGPPRAGRRPALRDQRRADGERGRAGRGARGGAGRARHRRLGGRARRGRRPVRADPRLRRGLRRPAHAGARDGGHASSTRSRARSARSASR